MNIKKSIDDIYILCCYIKINKTIANIYMFILTLVFTQYSRIILNRISHYYLW